MSFELPDLSTEQLRNLVANHRAKGRTELPRYLEAMAELARREGHGLDFHITMNLVREAASKDRFVSYKEVAEASKVDWGKAHYAIGSHLWDLVEYSHRNGWPLLSAIIVNKPNLNTGDMEPETLKGFIRAAHALGYTVTDEKAFLREQQSRVFKWAKLSLEH